MYLYFLKGCPKELFVKSETCLETCVSDSDCATVELCCRTNCGGSTCLDPRFRAKYRSNNEEPNGVEKCQGADEFMKCAYDKIMERVCD